MAACAFITKNVVGPSVAVGPASRPDESSASCRFAPSRVALRRATMNHRNSARVRIMKPWIIFALGSALLVSIGAGADKTLLPGQAGNDDLQLSASLLLDREA